MANGWFYRQDGKQNGPCSAAELRQLAASGQLQPDNLVWNENMPDWLPAEKVPEIFAIDALVAGNTSPSECIASPGKDQSQMLLLDTLFSFKGRVPRGRFCVCFLCVSLATPIFMFVGGMANNTRGDFGGIILIAALIVLFVVGPWMLLALACKCCHDVGWSGWLLLVFPVPVVNIVAGIYIAAKLFCAPSVDGRNRYG